MGNVVVHDQPREVMDHEMKVKLKKWVIEIQNMMSRKKAMQVGNPLSKGNM